MTAYLALYTHIWHYVVDCCDQYNIFLFDIKLGCAKFIVNENIIYKSPRKSIIIIIISRRIFASANHQQHHQFSFMDNIKYEARSILYIKVSGWWWSVQVSPSHIEKTYWIWDEIKTWDKIFVFFFFDNNNNNKNTNAREEVDTLEYLVNYYLYTFLATFVDLLFRSIPF